MYNNWCHPINHSVYNNIDDIVLKCILKQSITTSLIYFSVLKNMRLQGFRFDFINTKFCYFRLSGPAVCSWVSQGDIRCFNNCLCSFIWDLWPKNCRYFSSCQLGTRSIAEVLNNASSYLMLYFYEYLVLGTKLVALQSVTRVYYIAVLGNNSWFLRK